MNGGSAVDSVDGVFCKKEESPLVLVVSALVVERTVSERVLGEGGKMRAEKAS